ncbi:MAG TPA: pectate lyase, partial [Methylomirabilota bacterium]|nr:pectate lyase [Methylomirabilota bacterium]
GSTSSTSGGSGKAPYWVRLVRSGNTFTAYKSSNGTTWTTVSTHTISMNANTYIGLAVTSRRDGTLNTSRFDNVSATP